MAYKKLTASIPANWWTFNLTPGNPFGSASISGSLTPPDLPILDLNFNPAGGAGNFDLVGLVSGTLTNDTPGTTDTLTVDLTNLTDPQGAAFTNMVKLVGILTMNFAQDGSVLTMAQGTTNPFTSMFTGTGGITIGPAYQSPINSQWKYGFDARLRCDAAAYAVSSTNKTIKYTSGTSVSLPFRAIIFGRSV